MSLHRIQQAFHNQFTKIHLTIYSNNLEDFLIYKLSFDFLDHQLCRCLFSALSGKSISVHEYRYFQANLFLILLIFPLCCCRSIGYSSSYFCMFIVSIFSVVKYIMRYTMVLLLCYASKTGFSLVTSYLPPSYTTQRKIMQVQDNCATQKKNQKSMENATLNKITNAKFLSK